MSSNLKKVLGLLGNHKVRYFTAIIICSMTFPLYQIGYAFISQSIFNAIELHNLSLFYNGLLALGVIVLVVIVVQPITGYYYEREVYKPIISIERNILSNAMQLPMKFFDKNHSSGIFSRITNDLEILSNFIKDYTYDLMYQIIYGVGAFISLLILDARFLPPLLLLGLLTLLAGGLFGKRFFNISAKIQEGIGKANEYLSDLLSGIQIIKVFRAEKVFAKQYEEQNKLILSYKQKQNGYSFKKNVIDSIISLLGFFIVFAMGVYFYSQGTMMIGTLTAVLALQDGVVGYFVAMSQCIKNYKEVLAGAVRIFDLLDNTKEEEKAECLNYEEIIGKAKNAARLESVSFAYEEEKNDILENINMVFRKDAITAIIGESGSGKSSIFKLLLNFYKPNQGAVCVFDKNTVDYGVSQLRSLIGYVQQSPVVLINSIKENIRYGKLIATDEEVVEAAKMAGLHDLIMSLPEKYDTIIGPGGVGLSGGELQRVEIARVFLKSPPIILMDEPTSALDYLSEQIIGEAVDKLRRSHTVIIIAHRLSTIRNAEYIYVMDKGHVAEEGKYDELLSREGKLYSLHMKGIVQK